MDGERVKLRDLELNDAPALFEILSDKETMKYYPGTYSLKQVENWIERSIQSYQEFGYGLWAVELKAGKKFIGQCGISNQNIQNQVVPEIGFHLNKNFWGFGYGLESASIALNFGFMQRHLDELWIITSIENTPAIRIAKRLGMSSAVSFQKKFENQFLDHVAYKISFKQWETQSKN